MCVRGCCSGRAFLFFIMALAQRGSTKDHGTRSSKRRRGMRHVSLVVTRKLLRQDASTDALRRRITSLLLFIVHLEEEKEKQKDRRA